MHCWWCGARAEVVEIGPFGSAEPMYVPGRWESAAVDHHHAASPPSPEELVAAGHRALMRVREQAIGQAPEPA